MGAAVTAEPKAKKSKADVSPESPTPSAFELEAAYGAPAGLPLFLTAPKSGAATGIPPVQRKCAKCEEAEEEERREQIVQTKCACGGGAKCTCHEKQQAPVAGMQGTAHAGVTNASEPLPHLERIQNSFGRHDVSFARTQVGGTAAQANERMGSLAYTSGGRIGFRNEPDVKLAAHEAAHVVQQRSGAKLPGGVGRPGDPYEQQADAAADAVDRGESAEPILDRSISVDAAGDSSPAVQHQLQVNATRIFEAEIAGSDAMLGGSAPAAGTKAATPAAKPEKGGAKQNAKDKEDGGDAGGASGKKAAGGGAGPQPAGAAPASGTQAVPQGDGQAPAGQAPGGAAPAPAPAAPGAAQAPASPTPEPGATPAPAPGAPSPAAPAPSAAPGAATAPGKACAAECYRGEKEEPKDEEKTDEKPADVPGGKSQEETHEGDEPDLPEPDDCQTQQAQAGVPAAGATSGAGGPASATSAPSAAASPVAAGPAPAPAGPAQPGAAQTAGAGAPAPAAASTGGAAGTAGGGGGGGGGGQGPAGKAAAEGASPIEGSIAQSEGGRAAAVAAYEASSKALDASADDVMELRSGVEFAAPAAAASDQMAQRDAAMARANRFFSHAADGLEEAIAFASGEAPSQLGAQAEAGKAEILASAEAQKAAVSARIAGARDQARGDAGMAKGAVVQQADSFVAQVQAQSAGAIASLVAAHAATMGQLDALETTTLDEVNQIYANGRTQLLALGTTVGDECTAIGEQFATTYEGFEHCTENGFWDGDLSERRAGAQAEAARKTAKGYHDSMVDKSKKRAHEVVKDGRKKNRCQVITTASAVRGKLDETLAQLTTTIEAARDHAIEQASTTRSLLLATIDSSLGITLSQLDQQEHQQRQSIDDTCYLQQVLQEQMAHSAAASLQGLVSTGASTLHESLTTLRAQFASSQAPDPKALDDALSTVTHNVDAALAAMQGGLAAGHAAALQQLNTALGTGIASLAALVNTNDEVTSTVSAGFSSSMGTIAGEDNFAGQRAGFSQMVDQATTGGIDGFQKIFGAMKDGCDKTKADSQKSLKQATADLEKSLRQGKQGIECQITKAADEAASHEAPAWKRLIAVLLIIIVIVIVIAVTVLTAGAGLGLLAVIALGAVVGAVTSGLIAMASNLWTNQSVMKGVGKAVLIGAITGAAGGAIGMGIGAVVGKAAGIVGELASVTISKAAVEVASTMIAAAVIDVGSQFVEGGFSFKKFSIKQLGFDLALALVMHGVGKAVEPGIKVGAPEPSLEPGAPKPGAAEALPPEAKPAELPAAEAKTVEPPAEAGTPAPTSQEKTVLENTATKGGEELSPSEVKTERQIANKGEAKPINDPPFTSETELPNGHKMKQSADGKVCERCSPGCGVYDENGNLIRETEPKVAPGEQIAATPSDEPAFKPGGRRNAAAVKGALRDAGLTEGEIVSFGGADAKTLGPKAAARVAQLGEHFTEADLKALGGYLERSGVVLTDDTVAALIENVPRGGMGDAVASLETAEVRAPQTGVEPLDPESMGSPEVSEPKAPPTGPRQEPAWRMAEKQLKGPLEKIFGPGWQESPRIAAPGAAPKETLGSTVPEYYKPASGSDPARAFEVKRFDLNELGIGTEGQRIAAPSERSLEALARARTQIAGRRWALAPSGPTEQSIVFNVTGQGVTDPQAVGQQLRSVLGVNNVAYDRVWIQDGSSLIEIR